MRLHVAYFFTYNSGLQAVSYFGESCQFGVLDFSESISEYADREAVCNIAKGFICAFAIRPMFCILTHVVRTYFLVGNRCNVQFLNQAQKALLLKEWPVDFTAGILKPQGNIVGMVDLLYRLQVSVLEMVLEIVVDINEGSFLGGFMVQQGVIDVKVDKLNRVQDRASKGC